MLVLVFLVLNSTSYSMERKRAASPNEQAQKQPRLSEEHIAVSRTLNYLQEDLGSDKFELPVHVDSEKKNRLVALLSLAKENKSEELQQLLHKKELKELYELIAEANYFDVPNLFKASQQVIAKKIMRKDNARKLLEQKELPLNVDVNKSLVPLCLSSAAKLHWLIKEKMMTNGSDGLTLVEETLETNNHKLESVAFNHAGTLVVGAGFGNDLQIWDYKSKSLLKAFPAQTGMGYSVAFKRDDSMLACGRSRGTVVLYDPNLLQETAVHTLPEADALYSVTFNPTGDLLACGSSQGKVSLLQPAKEGAVVTTFTENAAIYVMAFDRNDTVLAVGSADGSLRLWDYRNAKRKQTLQEHDFFGGIWSIAFNHVNTILASGSEAGAIRLWNFSSGKKIREMRGKHAVQSVAFDANDTMLVAADELGSIIIWDFHTGTEIFNVQNKERVIRSINFNTAGTALACDVQMEELF